MQLIKENNVFYCSSLLAPRALRANRNTRKKLSLKTNTAKSMTPSGKTYKETRRIEETLARKPQARLRFASINVGTLIGRSAEVTETLGRRNVDVAALQEVRSKNERTKN